MVFSGVFLFFQSADARLVCAHDDEQVFRVEADGFVGRDDFDVG